MKIMLTAAGKRIQLIKHLKEDNYIVGLDCTDLVACRVFVDKFYKIPSIESSNYIERILELIKEEEIEMLIPLHEEEFSILNYHRNEIIEAGAILLLSNNKVIEVFDDKFKTYEFFRDNNISTPKTYYSENLIYEDLTYPIIIKPKKGMGSKGIYKIECKEELEFFIKYQKGSVIQQFIEGIEYTIDVLCDLDGNILTIVPRERLEIRAGEVSKSKTVKHTRIIAAVRDIAFKINRSLGIMVGPITFQCIEEENGKIHFIEINPRFGGGVPLTFEAGINYSLIFNMIKNNELIPDNMRVFEELTMIRFDDAVFGRW